MFNKLIKKLLEGYNVYPRAQFSLTPGPSVNSTGVTPSGFLGGGQPGINPPASQLVLKPNLKKKKKLIRRKAV